MGILEELPEWRNCAFCPAPSPTYMNGRWVLFKWSTRRYAHAYCLWDRKRADAVDLIPIHQFESFLGQLQKMKIDRKFLREIRSRMKVRRAAFK